MISDSEEPEAFSCGRPGHVGDSTFRAVTAGDGMGMHIRKIHKNTPLLLFENVWQSEHSHISSSMTEQKNKVNREKHKNTKNK